MFLNALDLSIPKIGFNITLSLTVKKLHAFKFDGVAESDNTASEFVLKSIWNRLKKSLHDIAILTDSLRLTAKILSYNINKETFPNNIHSCLSRYGFNL